MALVFRMGKGDRVGRNGNGTDQGGIQVGSTIFLGPFATSRFLRLSAVRKSMLYILITKSSQIRFR